MELEQESTEALLRDTKEANCELSKSELDSMTNHVRPKVYGMIDKELNRAKHKRLRHHTLPRAGQRIAGLMLVFFIAATTAIATVQSVRVRVLEFLIKVEKEYTNLSLVENSNAQGNVPADWAGRYYPGYIPEGFSFSEVIEGADNRKLCFVNDGGRSLMFSKYGMGSSVNIDTENADTQYEMINGWNVLFLKKGDTTGAAWSDFERYYVLRFDGNLTGTREIVNESLRIG